MLVGLQFLRFIAAASVLFAHSLHQFDGLKPVGVFGVDIFFVISGFIIFFITEKDSSMFLLKRLIRIVPLYWAFTLLLVLVTLVIPELLKSARFDLAHIAASLLFIPFWTEATLFSPILKLGWTLNLEMLFYLIFFASMRISHRYRGLIASAVLALIFIALNTLPISHRSAFEFYSTSMWFEFIFGMTLAMTLSKLNTVNLSAQLLSISMVFSFGLLIFSDFVVQGEPVYGVFYWGIPSVVIVAAVLLLEPSIRGVNEKFKKLFVWLGEMSYPMYLIHIYVIVLLHRVLFKEISAPVIVVSTLGITLVFSHLVNKLYDVPVRRILSRMVSRREVEKSKTKKLVEALAE